MTFKKLLYQNLLWRGFYFITVFLLNLAVARCYQAGMSGWINFISNNFALVLLLGSLSLEAGLTYFGASGKVAHHQLAVFALLWTVLVTAVFTPFAGFFVGQSAAIASKGLISFASVCYVSGILLTNFLLALFAIRKEFMVPNMVLSLFNLLLVLLAPWPGGGLLQVFDRETYLYFYYAAYVLQALALLLTCWFMYGWPGWRPPSLRQLKPLFRFSLTALAGNLVFFFVYRVDYWFINYFRGNDAELGNYIQASKLGQMLLVVANIIAGTVFPQTAGGMKDAVNRKIKLISRNLLLLFAGITLVTLVAGGGLFTFVFGGSFNQMFIPFVILLPGIFCLSVLFILSAYFGGKNQPMVNVKSALAGLAVIVLGNWLLIPRYGIAAAAAVSTAGYFVSMMVALVRYKKDYQTPIRDFFMVRKTDLGWWKQLWRR